MADGAVRFIAETIDSGDQNSAMVTSHQTTPAAGSESPFGTWGAMGTRSGREVTGEEAL